MLRAFFVIIAAGCFGQSFDYDRQKPLDIQTKGFEMRSRVRIDDITFANAGDGRTAAYLITPAKKGKGPSALFVHWYESESPLSNRKQFLEEAIDLANHGLTSLLVATPWSDPEWYQKRDVSRDYENSVETVKELRRALDVLSAQPGVDPRRIAYVGHDFGAMYGILAAVDRDVKAMALQAFTSSFNDWFFYNQRLTEKTKQAAMQKLAPLDPIRYLPQIKAPVLMQFANKDFFVPREKAEALYAAVKGPKQVLWYEAGHGLNEQASQDRRKWLRKQLKLR